MGQAHHRRCLQAFWSHGLSAASSGGHRAKGGFESIRLTRRREAAKMEVIALLYSRIANFQEDFEQEDRGVRDAGGLDLSPIFPAFLFNPAWPPLVAAPPRYAFLRPFLWGSSYPLPRIGLGLAPVQMDGRIGTKIVSIPRRFTGGKPRSSRGRAGHSEGAFGRCLDFA